MKRSPPKQTLSLFLSKCSQNIMSKKEKNELNRKRKELRIIEHNMNDSIILLRVAQSDIQDRDVEDNMRITGFQLPRERNGHFRIPLNLQVTKSGAGDKSFITHSYSKRNLGSSIEKRNVGSSLEQRESKSQSKKNSALALNKKDRKHRLSFPTLLMKAKRHKEPANASRNNLLSYRPTSPPKKQEETTITYEEIKTERQKVESIRHMTVLGKVIEENYKKQVKKIETRRKLFKTKKEKESSLL